MFIQLGQSDLVLEEKRIEYLSGIGRLEEEKITKARAQALNLPYINLDVAPIDIDSLVYLPLARARKGLMAILQRLGDKFFIAAFDPDNPELKLFLDELQSQKKTYTLLLASISSLKKAWRLYELYHPPLYTVEGIFLIDYKAWQEQSGLVDTIKTLEEQLKEESKNVNDFLTKMFIGAVVSECTDIHIEPYEQGVTVRFRIDGVLQDVVRFPLEHHHYIISRIKILSNLKLNIQNINQDGRFTLRIEKSDKEKKDINVRVSILPGALGEAVVMRLLGVSVPKYDLKLMGMHPTQVVLLEKEISKPNGMILTTGPTGSGKTTTLYACIEFIKNPEIKIITIEDPIEYQMEGVSQTQVNNEEGYTFEKGLTAIVRQDPDVIMVGEIRSPDAANMAINAALTGHLVFSTLHTNDAAGAVPRLRNLMVEKTLIPPALSLVIAQRLVRKLCPYCKEQYVLSPEMKEAINQALSLISPKSKITPPSEIGNVYKPKGCEKCFGTGYKGRTGIFEMFAVDDVIEKLILEDATSYELRKTAIEQGMITMLQHGLLKVLEGETSLEEVQRVAGDARFIEQLYGQAVVALLSNSLKINSEILDYLTPEKLNPEVLSLQFAKSSLEEMIQWTVASAFLMRASDIHLEPQKDTFIIRYRIDGVLHQIAELPKKLYLPLVAQIKQLSGMKIGVYQEIQEGRFSTIAGEKSFDLRISIIPGGFGETVVMRLLRSDIGIIKLEELGIRQEVLPLIYDELRKSTGMILTTGPTGAGKTTTLYAMLARLDSSTTKIITVENPIEYKLKGIIQTQIDPERGYTFETALKSLLRQDPDIMMIGEIRDYDTAQTAIQAALTGHLVLSTVHTNDSLGTVFRLANLGISREDISATINMAMAQRLVRRLCPKCKEEKKITVEQLNLFKKYEIAIDKEAVLYYPKGCANCQFTGFLGRIGLYEFIFFDSQLKNLVAQGASEAQMKDYLEQKNFRSLIQDGLMRVKEGITSFDEIRTVLGF